eukprot:UN06989
MAIRVMLESFIKTQKKSIQLNLKKHFNQYLNYSKDTNQLILHLLNQEVDEEIKWKQMTYTEDAQERDDTEVVIQLKDFQTKCTAMSITGVNLTHF